MKKLDIFVTNLKPIYVTPTGLKQGSKGKVIPTGVFLGSLTKGVARKVRKALRNQGHALKASAAIPYSVCARVGHDWQDDPRGVGDVSFTCTRCQVRCHQNLY